jgi:lysozyme family protein
MSRFEDAIGAVLEHEGGFVKDPHDAGGATNFGISSRFLQAQGISKDVRELTAEEATDIYRRHFWSPEYERIIIQAIATKVFDLAVNMGAAVAHRILQTAAGVEADGVLGSQTIHAVNDKDSGQVLAEMRAQAALHYCSIVVRKPDQKRFLLGWLRRATA